MHVALVAHRVVGDVLQDAAVAVGVDDLGNAVAVDVEVRPDHGAGTTGAHHVAGDEGAVGTEDHADLPADLAGEDVSARRPPVAPGLRDPVLVVGRAVRTATDVAGVQGARDLDAAGKFDRGQAGDRHVPLVVPLLVVAGRDLAGGLREDELHPLTLGHPVRIDADHEGQHDRLVVLDGVGPRRTEGGDDLVGPAAQSCALAQLPHADAGEDREQDQDPHHHQQFDDGEAASPRDGGGALETVVSAVDPLHHRASGV